MVLAVVALFGWGCAHFEPKPVDVEKSASDFDQRRLDAPELRAFLETNLSPVAAWPLARSGADTRTNPIAEAR